MVVASVDVPYITSSFGGSSFYLTYLMVVCRGTIDWGLTRYYTSRPSPRTLLGCRSAPDHFLLTSTTANFCTLLDYWYLGRRKP